MREQRGRQAQRLAGASALLAVALAVFGALGLWQYDGWQAQRAAEQRDLTARAPSPLLSVIGPDDPFPGDDVGRPVTLSGQWAPGSGFVVGPRRIGEEDGWWVGSIAAIDGSRTSVPVVLGWSPDPVVASPEGPVELTGYLQPGEGSLAPDEDPTDRRFPELRIASLTPLTSIDLVSGFVVAAEDPSLGLPAVPPEEVPAVGASTALRNLLYALQWWVLAGMAVVVWVRFVRDELGVAAEPEAAGRFGG